MRNLESSEVDAFIWTLTNKQTPDETIDKYKKNIQLIIENRVVNKNTLPLFTSIICSETPEGLDKKLKLFDKDNIDLEERYTLRKIIAHWKYENIILITDLFRGYTLNLFQELEAIICHANPQNLELIIKKWEIDTKGKIDIKKLQELENIMIFANPQNLEITLDAGITHTQLLLSLDYPLTQVSPENFKKIAESFQMAKIFKK